MIFITPQKRFTDTLLKMNICSHLPFYKKIFAQKLFKKMTNPINISDQIVRFTIQGKVTQAEIDSIYDEIKTVASEYGQAHLLGEFISFNGFEDFNTIFSELKRGIASVSNVDRYAILTDRKWMHMLAKAERFIIPNIEIKAFDAVDRAEAIRWLESG